MSRTVDVGIRLLGVEKGAVAVVSKVHKALDGLNAGVKAVGKTFIALNQTWELMGRVSRALVGAIAGPVKASLETRDATDKARKAIEAMGKAGQGLLVTLGDALTPAVAGLSEALRPAVDAVGEWVKANEQAIAQDMAGVFARVGSAILNVAGFALAKFLDLMNALGMAWDWWQEQLGAEGDALAKRNAKIEEATKLTVLLEEAHKRLAAANAGDPNIVVTDSDLAALRSAEERLKELRGQIDELSGQAKRTPFIPIDTEGLLRAIDLANKGIEDISIEAGNARRAAATAGPARKVDNGFVGPELVLSPYGGDRIDLATQRAYQTYANPLTASDLAIKALENEAEAAMQEINAVAQTVGAALFDTFWSVASGARSASDAVKDLLGNLARMAASTLVSSLISGGVSSLVNGFFGIASTAGPGVGTGVGARTGSAPSPGRLGGGPQQFGGGGARPISVTVNTLFPSNSETDRIVRDYMVPSLQRLGRMA